MKDKKGNYEQMALYLKSQIVRATFCTKGDYLSKIGFKASRTTNLNEEGYHIIYPDGYESWCPKQAFEKSSRLISSYENELIRNWE